MIRIGIVGTGLIAHQNIPALLRTGRVDIVALCNRTLEKAEVFATQYGLHVPVFGDYREMVRQVPMEAVLLNTPHGQHAEQFCFCAERGLSILVEKPLATTLQDAQRMQDKQRETGVRAAVCHTQRYLAPMMTLREYLRENEAAEIGPIRHVIDTLVFHYFHDRRPAWYFDAEAAGGGMLLTHGAHQIDRIHFLLGRDTDNVCARVEYDEAWPGIETGYQLLGTAGEKSYTVSCGGYAGVHTSTVQLDGERGTIRMSLFENGIEGVGVYVGTSERPFALLPCAYAEEDTYLRQFHDMLNAIEGKPNTAPSMEEAVAVMRVLEACRA